MGVQRLLEARALRFDRTDVRPNSKSRIRSMPIDGIDGAFRDREKGRQRD